VLTVAGYTLAAGGGAFGIWWLRDAWLRADLLDFWCGTYLLGLAAMLAMVTTATA
jgi:hypothetical protein